MPEFDFSEFHPLDHNVVFDFVECNHWYGGTWRHLELVWDFGTLAHMRNWVWRQTKCRFGKHDMQPYWYSLHRLQGENPLESPPDGYSCGFYCGKTIRINQPPSATNA